MITPPTVDDALHDLLVGLVREHGPLDTTTLARRARLARGDARITPEAVEAITDVATLLVLRPDGSVAFLGDVLDGIILTHRVRGSLRDRTDLWLGRGVQPLLAMAALEPLPLETGGHARISESVHPALVGPPGWLPPAERGDLIGLRWRDGRVSVRVVRSDELAGPAEQDHVRRLLAERCQPERWWTSAAEDDDWVRNALVVRALGLARLVDPDLLTTPNPPLDEVLYDPLGADPSAHWRDFAAVRQQESVSFAVTGMPVALDGELRRRAAAYGLTVDQFVIAILGHLAWRTPFAEDIEPYEQWLPERADSSRGRVVRLVPQTEEEDGPQRGQPPAG